MADSNIILPIPEDKALRFVMRRETTGDHVGSMRRILQQWGWNYDSGEWCWQDIPCVEADDGR